MENKSKAYGTWAVTTEGDVEGRTVRQLGTHTGYIDEIALYLADRAYYKLSFKAVTPIKDYKTPSRSIVDVDVDGLDGKNLSEVMEFFVDRDIIIDDSSLYHSFKIKSPNAAEIKLENARRTALAKLSDDDKLILGIKL